MQKIILTLADLKLGTHKEVNNKKKSLKPDGTSER